MADGGGRFLKDNAFLVGAVVLPVAVAAFFVAASAIPRWTVPDPAFDVILQVMRPFNPPTAASYPAEYLVRDGRLLATFRRPGPTGYVQTWALLRFDHASGRVSEVTVPPLEGLAEDETRTVPVEALSGAYVTASETAPDGYGLAARASRGGGIVGEFFGMRRYREGVALERGGRVITIELPASVRRSYPVEALLVGWVADGHGR